ncbi:hypothetical protein GGI21_006125, partial [Coemansia aciculifera]
MANDTVKQLADAHGLLKELGLEKTAAAMLEEAQKVGKKKKAVKQFVEAVMEAEESSDSESSSSDSGSGSSSSSSDSDSDSESDSESEDEEKPSVDDKAMDVDSSDSSD